MPLHSIDRFSSRLPLVLRYVVCLLIPSATYAAESVSFDHEVMAVLSRAGCNMGACHGNLNGKGGLQLSLRGQDPQQDYLALTHDGSGRRINRNAPELSLALLKPTTAVPHQGGQRIQPGSREYQLLHDWIAAGTPGPDPRAASVRQLRVTPPAAVIRDTSQPIQLTVTARFDDEVERDVTSLATYEVSNYVARATPDGQVWRESDGETTVAVRYLNQQVSVQLAFLPTHQDFTGRSIPPFNRVDKYIDRKLRRLGLPSAPLAEDTVVVRRIYLDLLGRLPTATEAREFVQSPRTDRQAKWVDRLLAQPEFADHWALKWSDLLRNEERMLDVRGVNAFHAWIRSSMAQNVPLDEFVRQLILARGSTYSEPPANFYRALRDPLTRGETAARLFLGVRLQCAKCHNHPFDTWTQDDYYSWAGVFAQIDYEIVENKPLDKRDKQEFVGEQKVILREEGEVTNARTGEPAVPCFLGAKATSLNPAEDRLTQLAAWLTSPANKDFARAQVNLIWYHLMGRGLVDPIDDFRVTNPASHPDLLNALAEELVLSGFDLRHVIRLIVTSRAYQAATSSDDQQTMAVNNYASVTPRRITAEQLLDAQCQVLNVPAHFNGYPAGTRAMQLAGVERVRRREQPASEDDRFLTMFGKPERLMSCECERSSETTLSQAFYLISGDGLRHRIAASDSRLQDWLAAGATDRELVEQLFWTALTRPPHSEELSAGIDYLHRAESRAAALQDLAWAVLNAKEFLFRR